MQESKDAEGGRDSAQEYEKKDKIEKNLKTKDLYRVQLAKSQRWQMLAKKVGRDYRGEVLYTICPVAAVTLAAAYIKLCNKYLNLIISFINATPHLIEPGLLPCTTYQQCLLD